MRPRGEGHLGGPPIGIRMGEMNGLERTSERIGRGGLEGIGERRGHWWSRCGLLEETQPGAVSLCLQAVAPGRSLRACGPFSDLSASLNKHETIHGFFFPCLSFSL